MIPKGFHRVTKRDRCPICERPDWCLMQNDGSAAVCARVQSPKPFGKAGWIHNLNSASPRREYMKPIISKPLRPIDAPSMMRRFTQDTTTRRLADLADGLGVSRESLRRIGSAWAHQHGAWAFPMKSANGTIIGIRLRTTDSKFAVKGGSEGLFIPTDLLGDGPLLICEGPTDTAAILDLGFDAIGRPNCNGAMKHILEFSRTQKRDVVIAANYDEAKHRPDGVAFFPGQEGAKSLAAAMFRPTKIIYPLQSKDFRAWKNSGATREAVLSMIANTRYFRRKAG